MAWRARLGADEKHLNRLAAMARELGQAPPLALQSRPAIEPLAEVVYSIWVRVNALRQNDGMSGPQNVTVEAAQIMMNIHGIPPEDHAFYMDCIIAAEHEAQLAWSDRQVKK